MVVDQGLEGGVLGLVFSRYRVSVYYDEKGSGDWLHSNVAIINTTELYS